jgi:hypothetical protein
MSLLRSSPYKRYRYMVNVCVHICMSLEGENTKEKYVKVIERTKVRNKNERGQKINKIKNLRQIYYDYHR